MRSRPALLLLTALTAVAASGTARAQVRLAVGGTYLALGGVGRFGVGVAMFVPVAEHTFDVVPAAELYLGRWSANSDTTTEAIYTVALDVHANLPQLSELLRAYVGTGLVYAGHGGDGAFGLDLKTGLYVRALGWRVTPFVQGTYRVLPAFETEAPLDTYFFQGGLRVGL